MSYQGDFFPPPPTKRTDLAIARRLLEHPCLNPEARAVLELLVANFGRCVTQREMAKLLNPPGECPYVCGSSEWVDWVFDWFEATTRKIRAIIESIRTAGEKYGELIICSFPNGKWGSGFCLEWEDGQVDAYMKRLRHESAASAETRLWNRDRQEANFRNRQAAA